MGYVLKHQRLELRLGDLVPDVKGLWEYQVLSARADANPRSPIIFNL